MKPTQRNTSAFSPSRSTLASAILLALCTLGVQADDTPATDPFTLGSIVVIGVRQNSDAVAGSQAAAVVKRQDMHEFNRNDIGDALNLLPGVTLSSNSRNEKTVAVRGFDSRQVPLYIDGIPVYVPYDGYVDFGRFTTADLAAVQVAKGFSSVAYGANTLGGAINLVSRKPKTAMEVDAHIGLASGNERQASANFGSNQGRWYVQGSAAYVKSDDFPLSSDFKPTPTEDGGERNNSYRKDNKFSLKFGFTPNVGDEYALSYYSQHGVKGQPPSTDPASARYWQWPYWDKQSLYFISKTQLGSQETLKVRLYQDKYSNEVDSFIDGSYARLKTSGAGSVGTGRSIYDDHTNGGTLELDSDRLTGHALKLVGHYKMDKHVGSDATGMTTESYRDALTSFGAEDNVTLSEQWLLSVGLLHNQLRPQTLFKPGNAYTLPGAKSATDVQLGLFYDLNGSSRLYATAAQKSRLPTLKDRYSARLGSYVENPGLQSERSTNYELGYQGAPWRGAKLEAALFASDIRDMIQSVLLAGGSSCAATTKCQIQNVGKVRATGLELSLRTPLASWADVGASLTLLNRRNVSDPKTRLTDTPKQKLTAFTSLRPHEATELVAFAECNGGRWSSNTVEVAGFCTVNAKAVYRPVKGFSAEVGVNNLADRNYALSYGFPNPGRTWFANVDYQF